MINVIMLVVFTATIKSAWYEGNLKGGGGDKEELTITIPVKYHKTSDMLVIPTNPPVHNLNIGIRRINTPIPNMQVVDIRGQPGFATLRQDRQEAQNLDHRSNRICPGVRIACVTWWDRLVAMCVGRRKPRPVTPEIRSTQHVVGTRLSRTDSYYPDRGPVYTPWVTPDTQSHSAFEAHSAK